MQINNKIFSAKEADIAELNWDLLMHFTLNNWTHENKGLMESATLMLHLPPAPSSHHTQATVNVYYVARDKVTGQPVQYRVSDKSILWSNRVSMSLSVCLFVP